MSRVVDACSNHGKHGTGSQIKAIDIRRWLLHSTVQIQGGSHHGGIAGWLDEHDQPEFGYGEITGYYLSSLSFMAHQHHAAPEIIDRMRKSIEWLRAHYKSSSEPSTRYYLEANGNKNEDWRNQAIFSFDLAMIVRGLSMTRSVLGASACADVAAQVYKLLGCLLDDDGSFRSHIHIARRNNAVDIPVTWSTQPGPYQVKTAAAILLSQAPASLRVAAEMTLLREAGRAEALGLTGDLHPQFYYLEGLLLLASHGFEQEAWVKAMTVYSAIMEHQADDGSLPVSLPDRGVPLRSDVIAQALRVGCILKHAGYLVGKQWDARLKNLADHLLCYCRHDGAVRFNLPQANSVSHRNAWCAMFAHQALSFYEFLLRPHGINQEPLRSLF